MNIKLGDVDFTSCCDIHDRCYGTCNKTKTDCDLEFNSCMEQLCMDTMKSESARDSCKSSAGLYYMGVNSMGCRAYQDAQKEACDCGLAGPAVEPAKDPRRKLERPDRPDKREAKRKRDRGRLMQEL